MLIATTNDLPGWTIDEVLGEVFGLTVRSRNIGSQIGAGLKSILGGELQGMTQALADSRNQVIERMVAEAEAKGGNAIVAMRFDTSEMGQTWTEICAYGTAVRAHPDVLDGLRPPAPPRRARHRCPACGARRGRISSAA
ncbi:MAG: YbjQ family protein, partial [Amnibacterium sp.]